MDIFLRGTYKILEVLKNTKAKGLEDIHAGDTIAFEIILQKRGSDRNHNWKRPLVHITNVSTGVTTIKEFSTTVKLLESFKLEKVNPQIPKLKHLEK